MRREGQQTVFKHHFNSSVCIQTKRVPIIYDSYIFVTAFYRILYDVEHVSLSPALSALSSPGSERRHGGLAWSLSSVIVPKQADLAGG